MSNIKIVNNLPQKLPCATLLRDGAMSKEHVVGIDSALNNNQNLLTYPYYNTTKTNNGVTFTDNGDGTITANGTSNASDNKTNSTFLICPIVGEKNKIVLKKGSYILSGCPQGGGTNKYYLQAGKTENDSFSLLGFDTGSGCTFTLAEDTQIQLHVIIRNGTIIDNLIFKPILEYGTIPHDFKSPNLSNDGLQRQITGLKDVLASSTPKSQGDYLPSTMGGLVIDTVAGGFSDNESKTFSLKYTPINNYTVLCTMVTKPSTNVSIKNITVSEKNVTINLTGVTGSVRFSILYLTSDVIS